MQYYSSLCVADMKALKIMLLFTGLLFLTRVYRHNIFALAIKQ